MQKFFDSNKDKCTLRIVVRTAAPAKIRVVVVDWKNRFNVYTDRVQTVSGTAIFRVRMPQSPEKCLIQLYNVNNGNKPENGDPSFRLVNLGVEPLKERLEAFDWRNPQVKSFVKFLQEFSEQAPILSAGHTIVRSDDNHFRIDYLDTIVDRRTGKELATPARINQTTGVIEVSKKHFLQYSIPMRMAILLHEISHFYLNDKMTDEVEADLNALRIYLGLGYPRIEAEKAFLKVFIGTPSDLNVKRHMILSKYIKDFDSMKSTK